MTPTSQPPKPAVVKRILCLANSRKLQGRCIAGLELDKGTFIGWIRPISSRLNEEINESERKYQNGSEPRVLDLISIPFINARPKGHQQENWLLDPRYYWSKVGDIKPSDLKSLVDTSGSLWKNGNSTYNGMNDYLTVEEAAAVSGSLKLILLSQGLKFRVWSPGEAFGDAKRRVQANFGFNGVSYSLWVTDPIMESLYLAQPDGEYALGPSYLTISLGEQLNGRCYKLVAAIDWSINA